MKIFTKKLAIVTLFLGALGISNGNSQDNSAIFEADEVTWYGLDFTKARLVGSFTQFKDAGNKSGEDIKRNYFPGWNNVIPNEPKKYELNKFLHVNSVPINLDLVTKYNAEVDENILYNGGAINITPQDIQAAASKYANTGKGIGVFFLVEKFDKNEETGVVDIVYFDRATGSVLLSDKLYGKPGGFGLKNYWIKSIYNVFDEIESKRWKTWKKDAKRKSKK